MFCFVVLLMDGIVLAGFTKSIFCWNWAGSHAPYLWKWVPSSCASLKHSKLWSCSAGGDLGGGWVTAKRLQCLEEAGRDWGRRRCLSWGSPLAIWSVLWAQLGTCFTAAGIRLVSWASASLPKFGAILAFCIAFVWKLLKEKKMGKKPASFYRYWAVHSLMDSAMHACTCFL